MSEREKTIAETEPGYTAKPINIIKNLQIRIAIDNQASVRILHKDKSVIR